jgi:hypothetical protein
MNAEQQDENWRHQRAAARPRSCLPKGLPQSPKANKADLSLRTASSRPASGSQSKHGCAQPSWRKEKTSNWHSCSADFSDYRAWIATKSYLIRSVSWCDKDAAFIGTDRSRAGYRHSHDQPCNRYLRQC